MHSRLRSITAALGAALLLLTMAAAEDSVPLDQLPPLVLKTLRTSFVSAKLVSATKEERNDYVHYYVKIVEKGGERVIEVLENGDLVAASPK